MLAPMLTRLAVLAVSLILLIWAPSTAAATDRPWAQGVSKADRARAQALLAEGNRLFIESRHREALTKYEQAVTVYDHPAIRFNIARALINLDRPTDAFDNIEAALRYGRAPLKGLYDEAKNYRRLLAGQIAELNLTCEQPSVAVTVDGAAVLDCPGDRVLRVTPGTHQVVGRRDGYITLTRDVVALPGAAQPVDVSLMSIADATVTVRRWETWKPWAVVGSGLVLGGLGAVFFQQARSTRDDYAARLSDNCSVTPCADVGSLNSTWARAQVENGVGIGGLAVGGAAVVTGLVLVILNRPRAVLRQDGENVSEAASVYPPCGGAVVHRF